MNKPPFSQFELFYDQKRGLPKKKFPAQTMILALFFLLFLSLVILLVQKLQWSPTRKGVLIESLLGQPRLINPLYADLNPVDQLLSSLIFRGLVRFDQKNQAIGDLAEKWDISADGKIYTVTLKKDQRWEDGKAISSNDVVFTYKLTQDQAYFGPEKLTFRNVLIEKINDWQIKFTLSDPFSPFLESLTLGILPEAKFADKNIGQAQKNPLNLKPHGSGRFKIETIEYERGQIKSITLKSKTGYIERLKFVFYPNPQNALTALKLGEVDSLATINPNDLWSLKNFKNINNLPAIINNSQYVIFFNLKKTDITQNTDFRRALALAMPMLTEFGQQALGPIPQESWAFDEQEKQINPDLDKAKSKMTSLNLPPGTQVVLTVPTSDPLPEVAAIIKDSWEKTGVKVLIRKVLSNEIAERIIPNRDFEILLFGQEFGHDPDLYIFWHSTQNKSPGLNLTSFTSRRADKALEEGRKSLNQEVRIQAYKNLQIAVNQDVPAIFLYQPKLYYLISKKIKNVKLDNLWSIEDRFNGFEEWYINKSLKFR